jgi:glutamine phosphoribosylpyrophosphate amidotransferase
MTMPIVATLFLALACVLGLVAWRHRGEDAAGITYADAAGALTLIGFFAAATIDPDQLVWLVESRTEH